MSEQEKEYKREVMLTGPVSSGLLLAIMRAIEVYLEKEGKQVACRPGPNGEFVFVSKEVK